MEWLLLMVLVPAILVPVVLLWGYSGCGTILDVSALVTDDPLNLKLDPSGLGEVTLTWRSVDPATTEFHIFRARTGDPFPTTPFRKVGGSIVTAIDTGLAEGESFTYAVTAVNSAGTALTSSFRVTVTLFRTIFTGVSSTVGTDQPGLHGACIVTRLPAVGTPPPAPWTKVRVTLRGSTTGSLTLDRVAISQPADVDSALPAATREAWDSHTDLQVIGSNVVLSAGEKRVFTLEYAVQARSELVVAFDLNAVDGQGHARFGPLDETPPPRSYFKRRLADGTAIAQAGNMNRDSDYLPSSAHYFVERVEVV